MRPLFTDRVARFVGLSVCHSSEPCKTAQPIEMPFRILARIAVRNRVLDGGPDPQWEEAISRGRAAQCKI